MRVMARGARDGIVGGVGGGNSGDGGGEPGAGMAGDAAGTARAGGGAGGGAMFGIAPFRVVFVVGLGVVTLAAIARFVGHGDGADIPEDAVRVGVLATGSMATFALDIGEVLERSRHGVPIAVGKGQRDLPAELGGDIVEATVDGVRVGVEADDMAGNAVFAVVIAGFTIDGPGEERGMTGLGPGGHHVRNHVAAAMAQGAGVTTHVGRTCDGAGDVGGAGGSGGDGGGNLVLASHIGPEHAPAGDPGDILVIGMVRRDLGSERAGDQFGARGGRFLSEDPAHIEDIACGHLDIHQGLEVNGLTQADSVQAATHLGACGERVIFEVGGG